MGVHKSKLLRVRVSAGELQAWEMGAKAGNMSLGEWVRLRLNRHDVLTPELESLQRIAFLLDRNNRLMSHFLSVQGLEVDV